MKKSFRVLMFALGMTMAVQCLCACVQIDIHIEPEKEQASDSPVRLSECTPELPLVPDDMPNVENEGLKISLPTITKQPVGESVERGSRTWIISQADGADGMRWFFRKPEAEENCNISQTLSALPGLELEVLDKGTLALRNIPEQMDGWSVCAEFYNASGSVFSQWAVIKVVNSLELYKPILDNLRYVVDVYNCETEYNEEFDPYRLNSGFGFMGVDGAGYKLADLDNNGVEELIIGYREGSPGICGIFTLRDNYPVVLGRSSGRAFLNYAGGNRIYYSRGPGGAGTVINTIYEVNGAVLDTVCSCFTAMDYDDVYKSYYAEGVDVVNLEGTESITRYRISDSDAEKLHREIADSVTLVPITGLTPIE